MNLNERRKIKKRTYKDIIFQSKKGQYPLMLLINRNLIDLKHIRQKIKIMDVLTKLVLEQIRMKNYKLYCTEPAAGD